LEREVQRLTEANLQDLFDLILVKSEFELHGSRIDTLAFDKESGAFVIIEYKKDRNFSIVDQGVAYFNLMFNNKADFILEYIHAFPSQSINKQDIDWSQSRIIFIASEFTRYISNMQLDLKTLEYSSGKFTNIATVFLFSTKQNLHLLGNLSLQ
jgi:hypothetical protein